MIDKEIKIYLVTKGVDNYESQKRKGRFYEKTKK